MSNLPIPEIYLFQISYALAANPGVSWRLNKDAKEGKLIVPDTRNGGTEDDLREILKRMDQDYTSSLLLKIHNDGRLSLGEVDVDNPHLIKTRYRGGDLERHQFEWEEAQLKRVKRLLERYDHLCSIGQRETADEFFEELCVDHRTGMGTKFGYVFRKFLRNQAIERVYPGGLPDGIAEFVLTADICSMKTGNQNIGEGAVDHYLDAAGRAFVASLRTGTSPFLMTSPSGYSRQLEENRIARAFNLGAVGADIVMGNLGYNSATLRPNGTGGDEMVASIITSTDPSNLVAIIKRINDNVYKAMKGVQDEMQSGKLLYDLR